MQITIDTSKDSKEDIRKAVAFLSSIADGKVEQSSNIFEDSSSFGGSSEPETESSGTNAFSSMFGDNTPTSSPSSEISETPILGSEESTEEKEDEEAPQLMEY